MAGTNWPDLFASAFEEGAGPKYLTMARVLREAISMGKLEPGVRLLPVRELAWQLKITPGTVARAYQIVTQEGLLEAVVGRGTFVARSQPRLGPTQPLYEDRLPDFDRVRDRDAASGPVDLRSPQLPNLGQLESISAILNDVSKQLGPEYLHYPDMRRDRPAREAVVQWLGGRTTSRADADDIVLTNGGQNGIHLVFSCCLRGERPVVLTEELSYPGFRHAARLMRAEVVGVPIDAEGLRADALELACRRLNAQVLCLTTEAQNPTTARMSARRREEIVRVARGHNLQILEDDCYETPDNSIVPIRHLAPERTWQIVSLSKTISAGLRFGAVVCPTGMGETGRLAAQHSFFGVSRLVVDVAERMIRSGEVERLSAMVHAEMGRRLMLVVEAFNGFEVFWQHGLSFLWLKLPLGWRASTFARMAESEGILVRSADEYALHDAAAPNAVRIAIAGGISQERFEAALARLAHLLRNPPDDLPV
ncbi:PLP-dependent aminotransferase family protein [Albirhodobacter sp. R86504]|uniref:aminotransferase-like domain-containing protein n=1 Tax=Albirhodobacter sp. R86504 TaxID=3093848 RepID=UPI00366C8AA7